MKARGIQRSIYNGVKKTQGVFIQIVYFLLGFVFSNIVLDGEFAPLGVAYCANCGFGGLVGTLFGYMVSGCDPWRYIIACIVLYFSRNILFNYIDSDDGLKRVLFTLWSMLIAGVSGNIFDTYTFKENILFLVSAIFSAFFAYIFSMIFEAVKKKRMPSSRVMCISLISISAMVFIGLISFGGIAENIGYILIFFLFFCLIGRTSLLYVATTALIYSFALCIYNTDYLYFVGILILGVVLGCLFVKKGRLLCVLSFIGADIIFSVYYPDKFSFWIMFYDIIIAGVMWLILPKNIYRAMLDPFIPSNAGIGLLVKKATVAPGSKHVPAEPCFNCSRKFECWQANFKYTSEVFDKAQKNVNLPDYKLPRRFCSQCKSPEKILSWIRKNADIKDHGCNVEFAKASLSRNGHIRCGDTAGIFMTHDKKCILCIADGMGTGASAADQSESVDRMIRTLVQKGVDKRDALSMVNEKLLKSGKETILGMDMSVIDMLNCRCEMLKADASPSFVVRNGAVYSIGSVSLPMGMTEKTDIRTNYCTLMSGDYLIMVSDGLISDGTKKISELISDMFRQDTPECLDITSNIMHDAVKHKITCEDDVTVIAARITCNK